MNGWTLLTKSLPPLHKEVLVLTEGGLLRVLSLNKTTINSNFRWIDAYNEDTYLLKYVIEWTLLEPEGNINED